MLTIFLMVYVLYCFRHCFLLSRTVCILINYAVILPKVAGRAQCGMFSFSYVEHAGHKVNRARLKRANEISRTHEPNGAFSLCVCSHARVLLAFSRTLITRAGKPKIFKKERSGAVGGGRVLCEITFNNYKYFFHHFFRHHYTDSCFFSEYKVLVSCLNRLLLWLCLSS